MSTQGLLDRQFVREHLTVGDPWCASHAGEPDSENLGAGMLYYALAYSLRAETCVCLGSGGGFVPRMMRQAQRDLELAEARTFLVDGVEAVRPERKSIWGSPDWTADDSPFRRNYPEVETVLSLTEDAFHEVFQPSGRPIDYLHIDADHHYDGAKLDFDLFSTLVPEEGVITLHDTTNFRPPCGVPQLLAEIREKGEFAVIDFPIAYGTAILKRNPREHR
jgi:hypothetical protein